MANEKTEKPQLILEDFLPYRLNKAAEAISQRFASLYREQYGLTRPEWRTLATLGQFGVLTATAIGVHSSMHKTKVSRAVFALEQRYWLRRNATKPTGASRTLELTPAGRKIYADLARVAHSFEVELSSNLGRRGEEKLKAGLAALESYFNRG